MKIIVDNKEKNPWLFAFAKGDVHLIHKHLPTADYTIDGFEEILCIERKNSISELAGCIFKPAFKKELDRMKSFKYAFLLIEDSFENIADYPDNTRLPRKVKNKIRVKAPQIIGFISSLMVNTNIKVLFCGDKYAAEEMAYSIMTKVQKIESSL